MVSLRTDVHRCRACQRVAGHDDASDLLSHKEIRCEASGMHQQVAFEVIVLDALLDHCDLHAIGQDFPTSTFVPSDLHFELNQRTPHVNFESLCKTSSSSDVSPLAVASSYSATSLSHLSNPSPSPACSSKRCADPSKNNTNIQCGCVETR